MIIKKFFKPFLIFVFSFVFLGGISAYATWQTTPVGISAQGWLGEVFNINESESGKLIIKSSKLGVNHDFPEAEVDVNGNMRIRKLSDCSRLGTGVDGNLMCAELLPCDLPWGGTINSGQSLTVYQNSLVACGSNCVSQIRTCNDGELSGSYTDNSCDVEVCQAGDQL